MSDIDEHLDALYQIQTEFHDFCQRKGEITEADTRAKVIDRILKEVCAWPESSINREEHVDRGYIDYTLTVHNRPFVAVEAKRQGIPFVLPQGISQKTIKIGGALSTDVAVREAVNQVRGYCDDAGIRYAVATNGYTWVVFRAIREDGSWRDGRARIFPSIEYISGHFTEFWNLLSYTCVISGSLDEEFGSTQNTSRNLYRVTDRLFNADLPLQRNRLHAQLEPLISAFFQNIADQDLVEILESCYVHTASLEIAAHDLDCVITDSIPRFLLDQGTEQLHQTASRAGQFDSALTRATNQDRGELFLVLGGIGSGKTTFLKRYQRTVGKSLLDEKTVSFHVDFLKAPLNPLDLEDFVWRELLEQFRSQYQKTELEVRRNIKKVFEGDIRAIRETALRGLHENSTQYERALSPYLEKWQQKLSVYVPGLLSLCKPHRDLAVVIFVDNVDQLSPVYQAQIFLLAQRVTRTTNSATIIALREESYYTANIQKTFTAYTNRKFHIASPQFRVLISNRIQFSLDVLQRSDEELQLILPSGIHLDKSAIADFMGIVRESIFQQNHQITRFIEAICFGNMRFALQMFTTFLTSGATDVDKMLRIYRREGAYYVAYHEFVKSIMLGERRYYREERSPIMNVFDCGSERNSSHFTCLRIIEVLLQRRSENTPEGQGYVEISQLASGFEDIFDNRADFIRAMDRLVRRQIIEVNTRSTESVDGASHARVTSAGWYYSRYLVPAFPYLDLVLQDTPLNDKHTEQTLHDAVVKVDNLSDRDDQKIERMDVRFRRVEAFLDYLSLEEDQERIKFNLDELMSPIAKPIVPRLKMKYHNQASQTSRRLRENRERFAEDVFPDNGEENDPHVVLIDITDV